MAKIETPSSAFPDLGHHGNNWVTKSGGLPRYIERIAKHLFYQRGKDESEAIAIAVNVCKRMCASGDLNYPGIQHAMPQHQAEACEAVAEFEAKAKGIKVEDAMKKLKSGEIK